MRRLGLFVECQEGGMMEAVGFVEVEVKNCERWWFVGDCGSRDHL